MLLQFNKEEVDCYTHCVSGIHSIYFMLGDSFNVSPYQVISLVSLKNLDDMINRLLIDKQRYIYHLECFCPEYLHDFVQSLNELEILYHKLLSSPNIGAMITGNMNSNFYKNMFMNLKTNLILLADNLGLDNNHFYHDIKLKDIQLLYSWYKKDLYVKASSINYYRVSDRNYIDSLCKLIEDDFSLFDIKDNYDINNNSNIL